MQVASIKTRVESTPEFQRLKLKCDGPLSNFAFRFNLRRYPEEIVQYYSPSYATQLLEKLEVTA